MKRDIVSGYTQVTDMDVMMRLTAYAMQAHYGDFSPSAHTAGSEYFKNIPDFCPRFWVNCLVGDFLDKRIPGQMMQHTDAFAILDWHVLPFAEHVVLVFGVRVRACARVGAL